MYITGGSVQGATGGAGGGVSVQIGAVATVDGAILHISNSQAARGGGLFVSGGKFMSSGALSLMDNLALDSGGGAAVEAEGMLLSSGPQGLVISGSRADSSGGAIAVNS